MDLWARLPQWVVKQPRHSYCLQGISEQPDRGTKEHDIFQHKLSQHYGERGEAA